MQAWTNQEELLQHWQSAHDQLTLQVCYCLLTLNIFLSLEAFVELILKTIYYSLQTFMNVWLWNCLMVTLLSFPYFKISVLLKGIETRSVLHVLLFLPFCIVFPLKDAANVLSSCVCVFLIIMIIFLEL